LQIALYFLYQTIYLHPSIYKWKGLSEPLVWSSQSISLSPFLPQSIQAFTLLSHQKTHYSNQF